MGSFNDNIFIINSAIKLKNQVFIDFSLFHLTSRETTNFQFLMIHNLV